MSIKAGTAYIDIKPDMTGFGTAVTAGVNSTVTSSATTSKLRSGLTKFGKQLAIPIAGALVVGLGASVNAASDLEETMAKVDVVFKQNRQEIKRWSSNAAKAMGMSQQAASSNAAEFGALFDAMKLNEKQTYDMSTSLVQLTSDLASFNNMDPAEVHVALRAAMTGEYDAMKRLGVVINETRIKEEALRMGLIKQGEELTAAEKAQVAYAITMKDTSKAQGDFARTADSMANRQRTVNAQFADTAAKLGQKVLPVVITLMDWLSKLIDWVVEDFIPDFQRGVDVIYGWVTSIKDFIVGTFNTLKEVLGGIYRWIADNVLNPIISGLNKIIYGMNLVKPGEDIPQIPMLGDGGIVTKPTLAVVGERGPEAVIPLDRMGEMGGGGTYAITITNWDTGQGYLRKLARDEAGQDRTYETVRGRMHRG